MVLLIQVPGGLVNQVAHHFGLGMQFRQGKLNGLIGGQGLAPGFALFGVIHRLVDAELRRAQGRGRLPDAVFVQESLRHDQAVALVSQIGFRIDGHMHILDRYDAVVRRHVEGPIHLHHFKARRGDWHQKGGDAEALARLA